VEAAVNGSWSQTVRLGEIGQALTVTLEPDAATRAAIARDLDLKSLPALRAEVTLRPWMDGVELLGGFRARVEQICGVTLEPFEQPLEGQIELRLVPPGSALAPSEAGEVELDLDAPDPPDVLEGDVVDVAACVLEHLALEIDPFPRKPDAEFDFEPPTPDDSPFAVLRRLTEPKP